MNRLLRYDWDVLAGIFAAVLALILHFFHIVEGDITIGILVVLVALILLRDLRREHREERTSKSLNDIEKALLQIKTSISSPTELLIGPQTLRKITSDFSAQARGDMTWFNVCLLMFRSQALFDEMLKPAINNPATRKIQFILDNSERTRWENEMLPKIQKCAGASKVIEPHWCTLKESVSFILSDIIDDGNLEGLLSFWGEPFMSHATGQEIPRYIFRIFAGSVLASRLSEMARTYRLKGSLA